MTQMLPQSTKDKLLVKVEMELERIYPNILEKSPNFLKNGKTDIVLYRAKELNKMVKGLTTKHLTGLLSKMKNTPVWS